MDQLDDFLKGPEAPAAEAVESPAPETPEAVEAEAPEATAEEARGPVRDEKGRFAPKGAAEQAEAVESPSTTEPTLDHAALIGERRRRQEAEERLKELERQLQGYQQPQPVTQQQPQSPPDRWEDPEGYDRWLIQQASETARNEAMQAFQHQRIQMSALEAEGRLPDYRDKIQVFEQMAQANPLLMEQMIQAPNPAEFAYNTAKSHLDIQQYGGIEGLIKARVEEALKAQAPAPAPVPTTLAAEQSAGGPSGQPLHVPSFDEILKR